MKLKKYSDYIKESKYTKDDLEYLKKFLNVETEKEIKDFINRSPAFVRHSSNLDSLPDKIELFENWERIEAVDNNIKSIPEGISKLKYLKKINLSSNKIK